MNLYNCCFLVDDKQFHFFQVRAEGVCQAAEKFLDRFERGGAGVIQVFDDSVLPGVLPEKPLASFAFERISVTVWNNNLKWIRE